MNRRRLQQAVAVAAVVVMDTGWCAVSLSRWVYAAWTEQTTGLSVCLCVCGRICAIFVYWLPSTRWQSPGDATAVILALRFISHMRQITALTACRPCAHGRPWIALVYVDNWRRSRAPELVRQQLYSTSFFLPSLISHFFSVCPLPKEHN